MTKKIRKILTIDELFQFCSTQNYQRFSSRDTGYQLAVQIPTTFEIDNEVDENHRGMMKLKFKIFHEGINRNNSKVPKESAEKAMKTIPDRPILAAIHQLDSGEWDFEGHEMEYIKNDEGQLEIHYIESQVGSFSSEPAFWEYDEKVDKNFVCAYGYISREYTKACEILERKQGSKNSCELGIDEFSYDTKDKCIVLEDFYVNASTLLGSTSDGKEISEGMEGSRADIVEFSRKNNSVISLNEEKIVELLEDINNKISSVSYKNSKEGGNTQIMSKFEELLAKYNKTADDITFDYENLSDEELEAKFAELFGEDDPSSGEEDNSDNDKDEKDADKDAKDEKDASDSSTKGGTRSGDSGDGNSNDDESTWGTGETSGLKSDDEDTSGSSESKKKFELSMNDAISALSTLVNATYGESDNDWYSVVVYKNYVVMVGWWTDRAYKQSYKEENENYTLTGDRVEVYPQYLTQEEIDELDELRKNYSALVEYKQNVEKKELDAQKSTLLEDERFEMIKDVDAYKELVKESEKYSLEEIETNLKLIVADYALQNSNFSAFDKQKGGKMFTIPGKGKNPTTSKYGGIFKSTTKK